MMKSTTSAVWALAWFCLPWGSIAWGVGSIEGHCGFERVKGVSEMGMVELYEWNLFLSPDAPGVGGRFCRLGAVPGVGTTHDGYYRIDNLPAGMYSIYINQPDFFASPKVVPNVRISDDQPKTLTVLLDVDYSCFWREDGWTDWGPWDWYQTFLATGTAVRGVTWRMAGSGLYNGKTAQVRILEDNGQPDVRQWK
ncbi:MAG TPA: carboxypeptidase regulatory-like domain-containing protein, partial [Phycisphaerales bacterium]|nr:carboxypeptidase regulatory-like domain-containing protein [Phycisphaerales bacterium]